MTEQPGIGRSVLIAVTVDLSIPFHSDLAVALHAAGCDVHVVSSGGKNMDSLPDDIFTHVVPMSREPDPLRDLRSFRRWMSLLRSVRPDVVIAGTPKASLLGMVSARMRRVPTRIYYAHGLRLETSSGLLRWVLLAMERVTAANATSMIAVSPSLRQRLLELKIGRPGKVAVIGSGSTSGVDLVRFHPRGSDDDRTAALESLGLSGDLPTIGFVGRLTAEKGIAELRDALLSLHAGGLALQALFVGSSEDELGRAVVDELRSRGLTVAATGQVADPAPLIRQMDVLCLPSYREGLPGVVLEAQASKVPVVASRVTGIVDIVDDGETGMLVPPRDVSALAEAIGSLVRDRNLAERLRNAARESVETKFDSRRVAEQQCQYVLNEMGV